MTSSLLAFLACAIPTAPETAAASETTAAPQTAAAPEDGDSLEYALLTINNEPVGYGSREVVTDAQGMVVSSEVMRIKNKRFGQDFEMVTTLRAVESQNGRIESVEMTITNAGAVAQQVKAKRNGDTLVVTQRTGEVETTRSIPLADGVLGPVATQRATSESMLAKGETKTIKTFGVETLSVPVMTITGLGEQTTTLRDGQSASLPALEVVRSDLNLTSTTYFDDDSSRTEPDVVRVDTGVMNLVMWPTTRKEAIASYGTGTVDLGLNSVVAVTPMPGLARANKATLLVTGADKQLRDSLWQRIYPVPDSDAVRVTSGRIDPRRFTSIGTLKNETVRKHALLSSRLIDFKEPAVQRILDAAPKPNDSAGTTAVDLALYVRSVVEEVGFGIGFASASEVCRLKEGDCSEHAVLLAALLRARGIPSRVSFGLVYGDRSSAFVPHMWTEAYLETKPGSGKAAWIPLDATRPGQAIGPAYITFGTSYLESDAPLAIKELIDLSNSLESLSIRRIE